MKRAHLAIREIDAEAAKELKECAADHPEVRGMNI